MTKRIGIDFDNTIVSYDEIFHTAASELGLLESEISRDKTSVRDYLRESGREKEWILLQGHVYGGCMEQVVAYSGAYEFIEKAYAGGHEVRIISHKTRHAKMGPKYDLHEAARLFLSNNRFIGEGGAGLKADDAFFEYTLEDKLKRIISESCDVFIDDLPELLIAPQFPESVDRYLFDPHGVHAARPEYSVLSNWYEAIERLIYR